MRVDMINRSKYTITWKITGMQVIYIIIKDTKSKNCEKKIRFIDYQSIDCLYTKLKIR